MAAAPNGRMPFVMRQPEYAVLTDFGFLNKLHPNTMLEPPVPPPVRPDSPPKVPNRRFPVLTYLLRPEDDAATVSWKPSQPHSEEATAETLPAPAPSSPPRPSLKRCSPDNDAAAAAALPVLPLLPAVAKRSKPHIDATTATIPLAPVAEEKTVALRTPSPLPPPPPPAPLPAVAEPSETKMMLIDYCLSLDVNYHTAVTTKLLEHMNGLNADPQYRPNIILLTGPSGCGKTFCVGRACALGGFDLLEMDNLQTEPEDEARSVLTTGPDPFGPHRSNKINVALFEGVDGMEAEQRSALTKVLQALAADERSKEKRRSAVRLRTNLAILTAADRYDPALRDLVYKLKPTEIKVNELLLDQRTALVEKSCAYWGHPLSARVYRLVAANPDNTSALLTKVESLLHSDVPFDDNAAVDYDHEQTVNRSMKTDERSINIFACCRTLLQPPETLNPRTQQYEALSFDQYEETWILGGRKVFNTLFNSYPNYVPFVPATPQPVQTWLERRSGAEPEAAATLRSAAKASMTDLCQAGNYFYRGLTALAELADGFSLHDSSPYAVKHVADDVLQRRFKTELQEVVSRNSAQPKIDVSSYLLGWRTPACVYRCNVQKADDEKFRCLALIRRLEAQRQIADFSYQPQTAYDLARHVGWYCTRSETDPEAWVQVDMFAADKRLKKSRKRKPEASDAKDTDRKVHPALECIKLYSHRFDCPDDEGPAVSAKPVAAAAKFMIRLSNGQYVERKPREKKR